MKETNKFYDAAGDPIGEPAVQFILSLAPPTKLKIIESDMFFIDDKPDYDLFLARTKQLTDSISYSRNSGQYIYYDEIYKPAMTILAAAPKPHVCPVTQRAINREIDDLILYLNRKPEVGELIKEELHYFPDNDEQTERLMKKLKLKPDVYSNLYQSSEYDGIVQAICRVRDLMDRVPYIIPDAYDICSIPIPMWEPQLNVMQSEAFSLGYFTGPAGMHFYTPLCKQSVSTAPTPAAIKEAKQQLAKARKSKILAYQLIVKKKLIVIRISNSKIIFARYKKQRQQDDIPF